MQITIELIGLLMLVLTHAAGFIWWAATITGRIRHIESWIISNEDNGKKIAVLQESMVDVKEGLEKIERLLIQHLTEERATQKEVVELLRSRT